MTPSKFTQTTAAELCERFGEEVTSILPEVTDDKLLPKRRRKELQAEGAVQKSRAVLIKLADKTCNSATL